MRRWLALPLYAFASWVAGPLDDDEITEIVPTTVIQAAMAMVVYPIGSEPLRTYVAHSLPPLYSES